VLDADDARTIRALRDGDEAAFMALVDRYGPAMLRIAQMYVPSRAIAEDVVQDAWIGVLKGIDRFERRSSLRTWIFRILVNTAKTRGQRERRSMPFSAIWEPGAEEPSVDPDRFFPDDDPSAPRQWSSLPASWGGIPEDRLLGRETLDVIARAIESLPPAQREVIRLRDVLGWSSAEVRNALDLSETNQRVLLHRARAKVRAALERYLGEEAGA
jgi:RNA polymerase sigma-70 factor (ECF subfamily)